MSTTNLNRPNTSAPAEQSRRCPLHRLFVPISPDAMSLRGRVGIFAFGLVAYAAFFATILYAIAFVANWPVPKSIDSGSASPLGPALAINSAMLLLFVLQHTIMARPWFKRAWTRIVPAPMERSIFVLAASACLALVFWQWRPLPTVIWHVDSTPLRAAISGLSLLGWAIVFASSFMVSHWDLFGLRQVWTNLRGQSPEPIAFRVVGLYRLVRHPLMLGFIIAVWATPTMTVGHLFFAGMITSYIFIGTAFEEHDLIAHFGERYETYRRAVPSIFPFTRFQRSSHQ